jgi:hypothetical protein
MPERRVVSGVLDAIVGRGDHRADRAAVRVERTERDGEVRAVGAIPLGHADVVPAVGPEHLRCKSWLVRFST